MTRRGWPTLSEAEQDEQERLYNLTLAPDGEPVDVGALLFCRSCRAALIVCGCYHDDSPLTAPSSSHSVAAMNVHSPPAERLSRDDRATQMREARRSTIMAAALELATAQGWQSLTRDGVAAAAGVAVGSINHEFGTVDALRDLVMLDAVANKKLDIIAQGIAAGHPFARGAPAELKEAAIRAVA